MADTVKDLLHGDPVTVDASATVEEAAKVMDQHDIGNVLVVENGDVQGIVTDRDIVVRVLAKGNGLDAGVREACTTDVETINSDASIDEAIEKMQRGNVRRLPVVDDGKPVGVISIGDLAEARDRGSALADISAAAPNN
jgi:CBS domain-containing protein